MLSDRIIKIKEECLEELKPFEVDMLGHGSRGTLGSDDFQEWVTTKWIKVKGRSEDIKKLKALGWIPWSTKVIRGEKMVTFRKTITTGG